MANDEDIKGVNIKHATVISLKKLLAVILVYSSALRNQPNKDTTSKTVYSIVDALQLKYDTDFITKVGCNHLFFGHRAEDGYKLSVRHNSSVKTIPKKSLTFMKIGYWYVKIAQRKPSFK